MCAKTIHFLSSCLKLPFQTLFHFLCLFWILFAFGISSFARENEANSINLYQLKCINFRMYLGNGCVNCLANGMSI